jgi:PAS domain-containing protein
MAHSEETTGELTGLMKALRDIDLRLEELAPDEADDASDRGSHTYLLRRSLRKMRRREEARQAAILNALPACVLLLDSDGMIPSFNDAWRRLAAANSVPDPKFGLGVNYLAVCDRAVGPESAAAHRTAQGIRAVLSGATERYSEEYACSTPLGLQWYLVTATPLAGNDGAAAFAEIRKQGGRTIAESEESAVVFGMPAELINRGGASLTLPAEKIAMQIRSWVGG